MSGNAEIVDSDNMYTIVTTETGHILKAENGGIYVVDNSDGTLRCLLPHESGAQRAGGSSTNDVTIDDECEQEVNNNEEDCTAEKEQSLWTDAATKLLLTLYKEKKPQVEAGKLKTLKEMYKIIRKEMSPYNYNFSDAQIENKWKTLERSYKHYLLNKNKTGRGRKVLPFHDQLHEILHKRHTINPPVVISSLIGECTSTSSSDNGDGVSECTSASSSSHDGIRRQTENEKVVSTITALKKSAKQTEKNQLTEELKQIKKVMIERHKAKEERETQRFNQQQEFLEQAKIKNELLKKYLDKA